MIERRCRYALAALLAAQAQAQDAPVLASAQEIVITAPASLPGLPVPADRLAVATDTLDADALHRTGATDLLRALDAQGTGISLDQAQGNRFQPNLLYRGYEAGPLGGDAQGLAVYVDGARFNQPFGDTVNWDLIPDLAVTRVSLEGSNPVFGLNALGGAVSVELKTGRDFHGVAGELSLGRFGERAVAAEAGGGTGGLSFYVAANVRHEDGWRAHSPSTLRQLYAQIGTEGGWGHVDLRLMGADTRLTGNGTAPVALLAADYSAVFTYPDLTLNRYGRALLSTEIDLAEHLRLLSTSYVSRLRQRTANGDVSDAQPCDAHATILCLDGDEDAVVTDLQGHPFGAFAGEDSYAQLNSTHTRTTGFGQSLQLSSDAPVGGLSNHIAVGVSYDGGRTGFDAQSTLGLLAADRGFADPQGAIDMDEGPVRPVDVAARRDDMGIFLAEMLSPLPTIDVTVAARYNHSVIHLDDRIGSALNGRHSFARLNPSVGLVGRLGGGLALYGGYAEASRAPTPAELSCANPEAPCSLTAFFVDDPDLHEVVARTFEGGLRGKSRIGATDVQWHVGGWRATNDHDILFTAAPTIGRGYFRNVGATRRQGVEAEASWQARHWSGRFSYVLTDATFRTGFTADSPDNPAATDGVIVVRAGDHIPGIARHRLKAIVTRSIGRAWVTVDGQYSSGRWPQGDEANLTHPTDGYWIAGIAAGVRLPHGIDLSGGIENLFDRRYATFGGFAPTESVRFAEAPGADDPRAVSPGQPRTWRLTVRAHF